MNEKMSSWVNGKIETIEAHSAGQPVRIVTDGVEYPDNIDGGVPAVRDEFAKSADWIRQLLNLPPRGHDDLVCAFLAPPGDDRADIGLFFTDNDGYLQMCGDGTIGTVSAFIKTDRLPTARSFTVETPVGLLDVSVTYENGELSRVMIDGITSFVSETTTIALPLDDGSSEVPICLSYAGHFYGLVDVADVGCGLTGEKRDIDRLRRIGMNIMRTLNEQPVTNPVTGESSSVAVILFYEDHEQETDDNLIVYGDGAIGLGPCGTGTCAKMAKLYAEGQLDMDELYPHRGPLGTEYVGRLTEKTKQNGVTILQVGVGGLGYITGKQTILYDSQDPVDGVSL